MTVSRVNELLTASFKGVTFSVRSEALTRGGRRIVLHEYPNSNERFVEDLGELPPMFSMKAFVHGENYQDAASSLEAVLKSSGPGSLSMPTLGSVRVYALPYSKKASQKTVGEIEFDLEFAQGRAQAAPIRDIATQETVFANGDNARTELRDTLEEVWDSPSSPANVSVAEFDLSESIQSTLNDFKTVVTSTTEIEKQAENIINNLSATVRDGEALANSLIVDRDNKGLWQLISLELDNGKGVISGLKQTIAGSQLSLILSDIKRADVKDSSFSTTSSTQTAIPTWPSTTAGRIKRNKNRLNLMNSVRVNALIVSYEQVSAASYSTEEEIQESRNSVEKAYQRLMIEDTNDKTLVQSSPNVRSALCELRRSSLIVLDSKEQSTFSLTSMDQQTDIGVLELTYMLYKESINNEDDLETRTLEIRELNYTKPADKLSGDLQVIQS